MIKKIFLPILAMMLSLTLGAKTYFNIDLADGTRIAIPFDYTPQVTYPTANTMAITSTESNVTYEFDQVVKFFYTKEESTDIQTINATTMQTTNGSTLINGLKDGDVVNIYSISGQHLGSVRADSNGTATIRTDSYTEKIIIVKTPSFSFKVSVTK